MNKVEFESLIKSGALTLGEGINNLTYLNDGFVLRKKIDHDTPFYDPETEKRALLLASKAQLSPKVLYFEKGNLATSYLRGYREFLGPNTSKENVAKLASFIKKLHSLPTDGLPGFSLLERLYAYKFSCNPLREIPNEETIINAYKNIAEPAPVFSHNDVVKGNVLMNVGGDIKIIDFEFASLNSPYFDLASFLSENNVRDEERKTLFLETYFARPLDGKEKEAVETYISLLDLLWHYWALKRFGQSKEPVFLEIAEEKLTHLL